MGAAAKKLGGTKGIVNVGCHGGKAGLNAFFAWAADCCDPHNIGFSDNIPMFKMQITSMPVYTNSGTNGRFKANRGAGSVCTMVESSCSTGTVANTVAVAAVAATVAAVATTCKLL